MARYLFQRCWKYYDYHEIEANSLKDALAKASELSEETWERDSDPEFCPESCEYTLNNKKRKLTEDQAFRLIGD